MQQHGPKGKGGRGLVGHGQWPFKWWFDHVLPELAMILGTDATTPFISKHKLYAAMGLNIAQDPVDSVVRWIRR